MSRVSAVVCFFSTLCAFVSSTAPNIVFLLADDLGWNDVAFHESSDILTPHLDDLKDNGLSFTYHYVQPQCTPSRAAFLTGRYPIRYGLHHDSIAPSDTYGLPLTETLLPQELQRSGYETFMVGKWHLGFFAWEYTPTFRGFDKFYGFYNGAENYDTHARSWDGKQGFDLRDGTERVMNDDYATNYQRDKCIEYIETRDTSKPFFLYASFQAVHSPNQIPLGKVWKSYKNIEDVSRRTHAVKATILDSAIGNIIDTLKEQDAWDNTIIVFTSDNGAVYNAGSNYPLRGSKSTIWEGGIRVPTIVSGGYLPESMKGKSTEALFHMVDWLPTFLDMADIEATRDEKDLDGMSQLSVIKGEVESVREGFLVHTDPLDCQHACGAYRWGKWKLIRDPRKTLKNEKTRNGCFWTDDFAKAGSRPTVTCSLSERIDFEDMDCPCGTSSCLFDITADPCEEVDLSEEYPNIVQKLYAMLAAYNTTQNKTEQSDDGQIITMVQKQIATPLSELFPPDIDGADPDLHGGFWEPWMTIDRLPRDNNDPSDLKSRGKLKTRRKKKTDMVPKSHVDSKADSSNTSNSGHAILKWTLVVIVGLIVALSANMVRINFCKNDKGSARANEVSPLLKSDHYRRHGTVNN